MGTQISFSTPLWRYSAGKGSWYFITLPKDDADFLKWIEDKKVVGFGFIRVRAMVGNSSWETTLFPSKEHGSYLLCINKKVRMSENISEGSLVNGIIELI